MTVEEAIKIVRGESVGYPVSCDEQINAAKYVADYAEKYLKQKEAWKKIKEEIINLQIVSSELTETGYNSLCRHFEVLQIIDKYTKEIENDN